MKNITVRTCLDRLSGDVMIKSVHKYKKLTKLILIYTCNTDKCSGDLTSKKVFCRPVKKNNKTIKCGETDLHQSASRSQS